VALTQVAPRRAILGYLCLATCVVALAAARLLTGGWYGVYEPFGLNVIDGWPVAWEALYYVPHLPTFLGDGQPPGFAPVQYRTFVNLYLGSLLYGWTGSAYWSLAAVDVAFWFLGSAAALHAMRRFGASPLAAGTGTFLLAASPVLVSNMWRHDLHVANFSTVALGTWAALVIVDEVRPPLRLCLALGALLVLLSLSYQYQWVVLPVAAVLLRFRARHSTARSLAVALGALVLLLVGTVVIRAAFGLVGLTPTGLDVAAVQQPDQLVGRQLTGVRSLDDLRRLLPGPQHVAITLQAYHPLVFFVGIAGLFALRPHVRLAALVASLLSLVAITLYPAPWTAMSAYPFVYLGAGQACALAGASVGGLLRLRRPLVAVAVAVGLAVGLAALTNGDLWGDYRFLLSWWRLYFPQRVF
jgi:hypothetical protein